MPQLFSQGDQFYSLEMYHVMGSRILSRSFTIKKWEDEEQNGDEEFEEPDDSEESGTAVEQRQSDAMDVDEPTSGGESPEAEEEHEEDEDDSSDVAMVPMADMLNARYGTENVRRLKHRSTFANLTLTQAKLFYEKHELKMTTTKPIKQGEQIVA